MSEHSTTSSCGTFPAPQKITRLANKYSKSTHTPLLGAPLVLQGIIALHPAMPMRHRRCCRGARGPAEGAPLVAGAPHGATEPLAAPEQVEGLGVLEEDVDAKTRPLKIRRRGESFRRFRCQGGVGKEHDPPQVKGMDPNMNLIRGKAMV